MHIAVYILNRLPSSVLHWKSLFKVLQKRLPDYDFMKVFGCLCFVINNAPYKLKFEDRSFKCVFLGYLLGHKAYKTFDLETHKIYISRDAKTFFHI